jgi:hypothetical protein
MLKTFLNWIAPPTKGWPLPYNLDPRFERWQKKWKQYVEQQTKFFNACGTKYPRTGNESITEIVAEAIMQQSKDK